MMNIKQAIKEYQCPGCVAGSDLECGAFKQDSSKSRECSSHRNGTFASGIGSVLLGLPKGFCRLGSVEYQKDMPQINIFKLFKTFQANWGSYNKFNRPVWKYLDSHGNTLIRGIMPRINHPFIHIILGNNMGKIDCIEITQEDIDEMD